MTLPRPFACLSLFVLVLVYVCLFVYFGYYVLCFMYYYGFYCRYRLFVSSSDYNSIDTLTCLAVVLFANK